MRRHAPATDRNREPLLEVLSGLLAPGASVLEIASGTGQHARFFTDHLDITWQPTDGDAEALPSIAAWAEGQPRVRPPRQLDVLQGPWPEGLFDLVLAVNLIHISPWASTNALFEGAASVVAPEGLVVLYGPYKRGGQHTAESNVSFEGWLRSLSPDFGVRDLEAVLACAEQHGFEQQALVPMPANNFTVVLRRVTSRL